MSLMDQLNAQHERIRLASKSPAAVMMLPALVSDFLETAVAVIRNFETRLASIERRSIDDVIL